MGLREGKCGTVDLSVWKMGTVLFYVWGKMWYSIDLPVWGTIDVSSVENGYCIDLTLLGAVSIDAYV